MAKNKLICTVPGGGGGHFHWRAYQRGEKRGKGVSKSGVGAERADRKKGVKMAKKGEKGIQIGVIRVLATRSYVEMVGKLRQHLH